MDLCLHQMWQSIPTSTRQGIYSLPLFIQWWPAFLFEKDKEALDTARFTLGLSLLFLCGSLVSQGIYSLGALFNGDTANLHLIFYYFSFFLQLFFSLSYLILSALLLYEAFGHKKLRFCAKQITLPTKLVAAMEKFFETEDNLT